MPSDEHLRAMEEAFRQAGFGPAWPFLWLILLVAGGVLVYFGFAWLPEEVRDEVEQPLLLLRLVTGWVHSPSAVGMIVIGGWFIYLGCKLSP